MSDWRDEEMARRAAGQIRALSQNAHEEINARHYPGTRQLCVECDAPTGRCEEDSIYIEDMGPFCEACLDAVVAADEAAVRRVDAAWAEYQAPCSVCGQQWRDGSLHADCPNSRPAPAPQHRGET